MLNEGAARRKWSGNNALKLTSLPITSSPWQRPNFGLSVHYKFHNKTPEASPAGTSYYASGYKPVVFDIFQLAAHVDAGNAFCIADIGTERKGANFQAAQLIGLDFDTKGIEELIQDAFILDRAALIYETASSTAAAPRARVIFVLDRSIIDAATYTKFVTRLLALYPEADQSCKDAARLFFGSASGEQRLYPDNVLPVELLENLPDSDTIEAPLKPEQGSATKPLLRVVQGTDNTPLKQINIPRIEAALGISAGDYTGEFAAVCCPFHDDSTPSASFHRDKGFLKCHSDKCPDKPYLLKDIAAQLGIELIMPVTERKGIHDSFRQTLTKRGLYNIPRIFDAFDLCHVPTGQGYTANEIEAALADLKVTEGKKKGQPAFTYHTIKRILDTVVPDDIRTTSLCVHGCIGDATAPLKTPGAGTSPASLSSFLGEKVFFCKSSCFFSTPLKEDTEDLQKNKRGRPAQTYYIPTEEELARWLDIQLKGQRQASADAVCNGKGAYKKAIQQYYIERNEGEHSRAQLGEIIDVGKDMAGKYAHANPNVNVKNQGFRKIRQITAVKQCPQSRGDGALVKYKPSGEPVPEYNPEGEPEITTYGNSRRWAASLLAGAEQSGYEVWLVMFNCNYYSINQQADQEVEQGSLSTTPAETPQTWPDNLIEVEFTPARDKPAAGD
ncbi:MAG: hypothetical protein CL607_28740 [Anaerolineaceae bacterium]|nr:hypothetical protein [Anaerolineaceae bacterium]